MASVDQASKRAVRSARMGSRQLQCLAAALGLVAAIGPARILCAPNFIVIVTDDLGIGDIGSYGSTEIRTPALDRLAAEGVRLEEFYTPAPTCSPARAALLTGRHPLRTGVTRVFIPKEVQGLPAEEITLAEHLKGLGYVTACVGKWHLGGRKQHRPPHHGFDEFFGVLYSNNMVWLERFNWPRIELFDGSRSIESPANTGLLTRRYTHRAIQFLHRERDAPFFLYLAYTMPHIPLAASPEFTGRSQRGPYGDVVEELDASIGHLMAELRKAGVAEDTYVFFTSDNGPWLGDASTRGGSTGGLRGFKGTTWEGGLRVPLIAWAPGRLPSGVARAGAASLLDLFPTISGLAGAALPEGREYDGTDILPLLLGESPPPQREFFFSNRNEVSAVRSENWKLHLTERAIGPQGRPRKSRSIDPPRLYRLDRDPMEEIDVSGSHPEVVARLRQSAEQFQSGIKATTRLRPLGWAVIRGLLTPAP